MGLFPQNDPEQAGLQAIPQAAPLVDASVLLPTAQRILEAGQAAGHLQQLSSQLALEKAQRKAEMAQTDYHIAAIEGMKNNLQPLLDQQLAEIHAGTAAAKAGEAGSTLQGDITAATRTPVLAGAVLGAKAGQQQASNVLATSEANAGMSALPSVQQAQIGAQAQAAGQALGGAMVAPSVPGALGAAPAAGALAPAPVQAPDGVEYGPANADVESFLNQNNIPPVARAIARAKFIEAAGGTTSNIVDKDTGIEYAVTSIPGKGIVSKTPLVASSPNARKNAQTILGITNANKQLGDVISKLDGWEAVYGNKPGFHSFLQGLATSAAGSKPTGPGVIAGLTSVLAKTTGSIFEDPTTKDLRNSIAQLNQVVANGLDGDSAKALSDAGVLPNPSSLGDPTALRGTLEQLRDRLDNQLSTLKEQTGLKETAPASKTAAPAKTIPLGTRATLNGVPVVRATKDGKTGWLPVAK